MMKNFVLTICIFALSILQAQSQETQNRSKAPEGYVVDTRIDNMGYWRQCAEWGLVPVEPYAPVPAAKFNGSKVLLRGVRAIDSPDVCTTNEPSASTQSENSIVINPNNPDVILNSNNSTPQPSNGTVKGADALQSADGGATWTGTVEGAGGPNSGDPAAVINLSGRWFIGYIDNNSGQSVSYSDDNGATWTVKKVANGSMFNLLDKNHLWVDISPVSPYKNNLYNGWMSSDNIYVSRSVTNGADWSAPVNISAATNAGSHNQGINFKCGPDGEVYAAWSVYDSWPSDEKAIGFAKSLNGGETWETAFRALNNTKGIRTSGVSQNMRTNSFPSMAVDLSNGPYRGHIYIVWTNIGYPGINTGSGSSVYMIKSSDKGATWTAPKRVNSDSTAGKHHYLPWIACDPVTGYISIVFYDNRNCASNEAEAWMAFSTNGGTTFEDLKVSDVKFTPSPIPNMASKYMGDYLAIDAYGGKAYPCWTDTRSGHCLTYVSPIDILIPTASIQNIDQSLNDTTFGNANGLMDYGETEYLGLKMQNTGTVSTSAVHVELGCDHPHITILDAEEEYGSFEPDQVKYIHNGFRFEVNDSVANHEMITFTVKATDDKDSVTWSSFQMMAQAPDVTILGLTVHDPAPGGNNNGRLDPGEVASILIDTKNNGIWDAEQVSSALSSLNAYVTIGNPVFVVGTLQAGQMVQVSFTANVHPSAPVGSVAIFRNTATSKYRVTEKDFSVKIGLIVEDWESGNFQKFPWQFTNPDKPWSIDPVIRYEKLYSARTGAIADNETTGISVNYHVAIDDSISFFRKISTQPVKDILKFYIDGAMVGLWSNFTDTTFRRAAYPVLAGTHTFKWVYEKNQAVSGGDDACWIDYIVFPPQYQPAVNSGGDAEICETDTYQLHGMAYSYDSVRWTTSGNGQFSDPTLLNPVYSPGSNDIVAGSVMLSITAFGMNGADTTNTMALTISKTPVVQAGPDASLCKNETIYTSGTASNYTAVQWKSSGDGLFEQPTQLATIYRPGTADLQSGSVTLTLSATGSTACPEVSDHFQLTFKNIPQVELGKDTLLCANHSIVLNATSPDAMSYRWLPSDKTTPAITVDSAGIGLNNQKIVVLVEGTNGCSASDSVMVGFRICGGIQEIPGMELSVYPNPGDGHFTLGFKASTPRKVWISVFNASGQPVFSGPETLVSGEFIQKIDLSLLNPGSYMLQVSDGSAKLNRKLVINR